MMAGLYPSHTVLQIKRIVHSTTHETKNFTKYNIRQFMSSRCVWLLMGCTRCGTNSAGIAFGPFSRQRNHHCMNLICLSATMCMTVSMYLSRKIEMGASTAVEA